MLRNLWIGLAWLSIGVPLASAQRDPQYDRVVLPQTRADARDLGHGPVDLIPDEESGITSLSVAPNGDLYGATSGTHSHLFVMNPQHGYVVPLGVIGGATAVTQAIAISEHGTVFIGAAPSGHLLEYTPEEGKDAVMNVGGSLVVKDRGVPITGESIAALAIDRKGDVIYGLTSPGAHVFRYGITDAKFADLGVVAKNVPFGEKFEHEKMMSRMLVVDGAGDLFASGEDGVLYEVRGASGKLEKLESRAPAIPGREPFTRVDAFILDPSGAIYGGTSDGYLFRLDPHNGLVTNLGKPLNQYHIAGLAVGRDGRLYGVGGDTSEMARMFSYDPATGAYDLLGFVDVNRSPYYTWQAYVAGAVVADARGTIYVGEDERISRLFLYFP